MKVKCGLCNEEATGRKWKLAKDGWLIIFMDSKKEIMRCPNCKPNLLDKALEIEDFSCLELDEDINDKINRRRMLRNLEIEQISDDNLFKPSPLSEIQTSFKKLLEDKLLRRHKKKQDIFHIHKIW